MTSGRRLLVVHAHPDDEALGTGGTLARYAAEGAQVCLVTCTDGELGEIAEVAGLPPPDELRPRLGEVRRDELNEACRHLGVTDLRMLGYRDSGMDGTDGNRDPEAFVNQDLDGVVARLVAVIREVRPQVAVTYDEFGFYGHPDHIRAHEATMRAIDAAADPAYAADTGAAHTVPKLYYTAVPKGRLRMGRELFGEGAEEFLSDENIERIGTDDELVTTHLDVSAFVAPKRRALEAHRTQYGTIARWLEMPEDIGQLVMGAEYYRLVRPDGVRGAGVETDLFEGL